LMRIRRKSGAENKAEHRAGLKARPYDGAALHRYLVSREREMVRVLRSIVEIESPSLDKASVDRCGARVASEFRRRGGDVRILRDARRGNLVRVEIGASTSPEAGQILVLGHLDTVYPIATLRRMPFRVADGRAWGPGTFDMKGGIVLALFAVEALRALRITPRRKIVFLWTGDEEIGSEVSRSVIEKEARRSKAVLVLEPSLGPKGCAKTQRKGIGEVEVLVHGRAAHAGVDPERGVNAAHELALQIVNLMRMNDPRRGITVQANVIAGGTATNVVPEFARAQVDVRFARARDALGLEKQLHGLRPILKGARIEVRGGINRPPLERTAGVARLFRRARAIAREIGFQLDEAATGGGSDGNLTAALGVPTLDGIGVVGDGAHSLREHVVVRDLPRRAALLAGLLASL
jgi:glutamate carboxypeptidase